MGRILLYIITVGVLIGAAVWFAENPGDVAIRWRGWYVQTGVPILLLGLLLFLFVLSFAFRLLLWLFDLPGRWSRGRRVARQRKGYLALINGLSAVAAGDADNAFRNAKQADSLLRDPPLTMLLSAQAAQLSGDSEAARSHFSAMLNRPETAFLGLRGLLTQALKDGDQAAALEYARRAHALNPDAAWLTATLFDLQARSGLWAEAQDTLARAAKRGAFGPDEARRKKAVVLYERALQAEQAGANREAAKLLAQAVEADPGFVAANVKLAQARAAEGKSKRAAGLLEDAWRYAPHPDLARAYLGLFPGDDPLTRARRAETLAAANPRHVESDLTVAEAALAAELWGQARTHLLAAAEKRPTSRVWRLLAEVEERETANAEAVRHWLSQAAEAKPEAGWLCRQCGTPAAEWSTSCPSCNGIDTITWSDAVTGQSTPRLPQAAQ
jgi:HemY protein